ncbi:cytochrome P450 307a1-like [Temnothorax curvispinosus]|uniref:Cytochrome P450 307a1-like n=1 Tax=Temnothorax curvispinosus TaxID=300111 RepID=A0A6J1Q7J0_9HYME|nr:cytochrome P450 307a1-like [Temnothorax curvispinosus]
MIFISATTYFLLAIILIALVLILMDYVTSKKKPKKLYDGEELADLLDPPGPKPWPVLGSLHILGRYDVPYKVFGDLVKAYNSQVIKIKMGSLPCVVVNGLENIKEVLITKGHHFDSRPNFIRYHLLFCGNKENSLAFCNWSDVQKTRREMLRGHTFPRAFTTRYNQLNGIIGGEVDWLINHLTGISGISLHAKPLIMHTCANIFIKYFCSRRFGLGHGPFREMIENFDKVFYEVNQGYAADFMPFLMPLHQRNMTRMANWSHEIRMFVEENIIGDRLASWRSVIPEEDYVDCLINHIKTDGEPKMTWDMALFALEDIVGGHSAVGNLLVKILGYLVTRPHVQKVAQMEIDGIEIPGKFVGLENRGNMPYTEAIILEAIRLIASPIVPHVANQDSSIAGYKIEKDTFIFLNNYDLNMSNELWTSPEEFMPQRFVQNGKLLKPEHFLPFGGGRRSCMGYKMVQYISFSTIATLLKNFNILPVEKELYKVPIGNLALPESTFKFRFERR